MAEELTRSLTLLAERGVPRGADQVLETARRIAMPEPALRQIPWRGGLALAAAAVILVMAVMLFDPFSGAEPSRVVTRSPEVPTTLPAQVDSEAADGAGQEPDKSLETPDTAARGAVVIAVQDWSGVDGYRLLAVVWEDQSGERGDFVGGAFWTRIDSDPYSAVDVVHPPYHGEGEAWNDSDGWGAGDYLWDQTAWLEPGTYRIELYANPGELAPFGSHIPADGYELGCHLVVEVNAGDVSTVTISDVPVGVDTCPQVSSR